MYICITMQLLTYDYYVAMISHIIHLRIVAAT